MAETRANIIISIKERGHHLAHSAAESDILSSATFSHHHHISEQTPVDGGDKNGSGAHLILACWHILCHQEEKAGAKEERRKKEGAGSQT